MVQTKFKKKLYFDIYLGAKNFLKARSSIKP